ncbi:hypothetical protein [Rhodoferax sp. WC2427]|uniref:hypothetical protein n=1 Tax=Rhodoferax sp. WC2427 TaxID=3234144 RepID=UPI0034675091
MTDQNIFHTHEFGNQAEPQERYPKAREKTAERFVSIRDSGMRAGPTGCGHELLDKARLSTPEETSRFERATRFAAFLLRAEAKRCDFIE